MYSKIYCHEQHFLCAQTVIITCLKKIAQIEPASESLIFRDQEVFLSNGQNGTKMTHPLRLVETKDREGNTVIIVTNCFELSANEIGELYRYHWKIETFFKWMKQHLKVKSFYGKSENAVCNQIWIALITYCLQVSMQQSVNHKNPLLDIKQTLKTLLIQWI
ncbi:transposase [Halalkalibacterium ligniniphilum]|uniref:transposase n=1 Tax=Halalkalibacterium ligniniphilum TaxID=1134413 RepID=UPI00036D697B